MNNGYKDCGLLLAVWEKAGGYYLGKLPLPVQTIDLSLSLIRFGYVDVGGSQYIIDGKIKLKNDSQIKEFTASGLKFENGSELPADVVIFCTG